MAISLIVHHARSTYALTARIVKRTQIKAVDIENTSQAFLSFFFLLYFPQARIALARNLFLYLANDRAQAIAVLFKADRRVARYLSSRESRKRNTGARFASGIESRTGTMPPLRGAKIRPPLLA